MALLFSVCICTRNRADLLRLALERLAQQTLTPEAYEVVVINNGSTDDTDLAVQAFTGRVSSLRLVHGALRRSSITS